MIRQSMMERPQIKGDRANGSWGVSPFDFFLLFSDKKQKKGGCALALLCIYFSCVQRGLRMPLRHNSVVEGRALCVIPRVYSSLSLATQHRVSEGNLSFKSLFMCNRHLSDSSVLMVLH